MKGIGMSSLTAVSMPPTRRCSPRLARSTAAACTISVYSKARCSERQYLAIAPARLPDAHPRAGAGGIDGAARGTAGRLPRWHRSNALIGAGPAGYVYQVCAAAPAATRSAGKGLRRP